jgi:hypothetical protein
LASCTDCKDCNFCSDAEGLIEESFVKGDAEDDEDDTSNSSQQVGKGGGSGGGIDPIGNLNSTGL